MKNIGILGFGNVGRATAKHLEEPLDRCLVVFDEKHEVQKSARRTYPAGSDTPIDALMVCVNIPHISSYDTRYTTPVAATAEYLVTAIQDAVPNLVEGAPILIRSTVPPGTCEHLQTRYPNNPVLSWPEFAQEWTMRVRHEIRAPYLGLSTTVFDDDSSDGRMEAVSILGPCELDAELARASNILTATQAEFVKLAWNVQRAADVAVFNELSRAASNLGMDPVTADSLVENAASTRPQWSTLAFGGACLAKDLVLYDAACDSRLGDLILGLNKRGPREALDQLYAAKTILRLSVQRTVVLGLQDGPGTGTCVNSPAFLVSKLRKFEKPPIYVDWVKSVREQFALYLAGSELRYCEVAEPNSDVFGHINAVLLAQKSSGTEMFNALKTILQSSEAPVKVVVNACHYAFDTKEIIELQKWGAVFIDQVELDRMRAERRITKY